MAKKAATKAEASGVIRGASSLAPGKGAMRKNNRVIFIYGPPKVRKTTTVSTLKGAKWVISDSNCVGEETEFITAQGVRAFRDCREGERVVVLTHKGNWKPATVRSYGKQPLYSVTFGRGRNIQTVRATANHRWLLQDGREVRTEEMRAPKTVSDQRFKLLRPPEILRNWSFDESPEEQQLWWLKGFIYGDGSAAHSHGKEIGSKLRLCGAKVRFQPRIESLGFTATYPPSSEGEPNFYFAKVFKRLATPDVGIENMTAFVRGFLDADGTHNTRRLGECEINPFQGISQTGLESIEFVRKFFPMVGAYVVNSWDSPDSGYGHTDEARYFSLLCGFSNSPVASYTLRDISGPSAPETVWCLEVEDDASFVLPSGVVTGNCVPTLSALDRLPPDEDIYEVSNLGDARAFCAEAIKAGEEGTLNVPAVVFDSLTQFYDWHQEDIARATSQRFLGDNAKNNGWHQFNVEFGQFLDDLAILGRYTTVVCILHAKEKLDFSKGTFGGIALGPAVSLKASRLANWILFQTIRQWDIPEGETVQSDDYITVDEVRGRKRATEVVLHTQPYNGWVATCNARNLGAEEPADLKKVLVKEGLWEE